MKIEKIAKYCKLYNYLIQIKIEKEEAILPLEAK